jgi:uncharacterized membrane protein YhaH (DUF805 family)
LADRPDYFWLFFKLSGRLGRAGYFYAGTLVWITQIFLFYRVAQAQEGSGLSQALALVFMASVVVGAWSNFALTAKRFHDFGKPTGLAAVSLVIGYLLVIVLSFVKSDPGPNAYGSRTNAAS